MHVAVRLLADGHEVIGIDNLNDYYDVRLKQARLAHIKTPNQFHFEKLDLCDRAGINRLFAERRPETVINLAAQAGVHTALKIRIALLRVTWLALQIFWRRAAILRLGTCYMPAHPLSMDQTRKCLFMKARTLIIR